MSVNFNVVPSCTSTKAVINPPIRYKTQGDILQEEIHEEAKIAKQKNQEDRTLNDYISIGLDTLDKIKEPQVVYANGSQKINYTV